MDGIHVGFIVRELSAQIEGARVDRVLMPEKDELHLSLRGSGGTMRLLLSASADNPRVHLTALHKENPQEPPMFCMLLRKLLGGARVLSVRQMMGDRVVEITFGATDELGDRVTRILSCEIMGRHSNIILRDAEGRILDAIRHVGLDQSRVREVRPGLPYLPPPSQGKLDPMQATAEQARAALSGAPARLDKALSEVFTGIGARTARELAYRLAGDSEAHLDAEARARLAEPLLFLFQRLPSLSPPVLLLSDMGEAEDAFPFPYIHLDSTRQTEVHEGQSAALDAFFRLRDLRERMKQKSASLVKTLRTHIERAENKLAIHRDMLAEDGRMESLRLQGELLNASLHQVERMRASVTVTDYYTSEPLEIALDPRLTPAQNAQKYYKQYQKMRAAKQHAAEQVAQIEAELSFLQEQLDDVRKCETAQELEEIRSVLVQRRLVRASHNRGKQPKAQPSKPLSCASSDGIPLLIGKNSAQNERLTQAARPEHLWLHAKDMPGSHVIVACTGDVPETTLREAAQLAAWFSRGFRSAQVPVDYTLRRHVRKPSGAAVGYFIYAGQRTLYVTPDEAAAKRILENSP